jgi:hypothetical protein
MKGCATTGCTDAIKDDSKPFGDSTNRLTSPGKVLPRTNPSDAPPEFLKWQVKWQESSTHSNVNDDRSPLLDLMTCVFCEEAMVLEKIDPDGKGNDLIQYRCKLCDHMEAVMLYRRSRT